MIAYYSTRIFIDSGFAEKNALLASMGCGLLNWIFAIPGFYTIDTFGRRNLLLVTFPLMAVFLFWTGFSFWIDTLTARLAMVVSGLYLFEIVYSPGEGPVPFAYSAEAFPMHIRDFGMSFATATTWFFNFALSFTWPYFLRALTVQGAFSFYACCCIVGWVAVFLFVPEVCQNSFPNFYIPNSPQLPKLGIRKNNLIILYLHK